jgi:hypothetical protein
MVPVALDQTVHSELGGSVWLTATPHESTAENLRSLMLRIPSHHTTTANFAKKSEEKFTSLASGQTLTPLCSNTYRLLPTYMPVVNLVPL